MFVLLKPLKAPIISEKYRMSLNTQVFLLLIVHFLFVNSNCLFLLREVPTSLFAFCFFRFFFFCLMSCTETTGLLDGRPTPMCPNNSTDRDTWAGGQGLLVSPITQVEQRSWKHWCGEIKRTRVSNEHTQSRSRSESCEQPPD